MPADDSLTPCEAGEKGGKAHYTVMYGMRPRRLTGGNLEGGAPWNGPLGHGWHPLDRGSVSAKADLAERGCCTRRWLNFS